MLCFRRRYASHDERRRTRGVAAALALSSLPMSHAMLFSPRRLLISRR